MPACPKCGSRPYVVGTQTSDNGDVRRRYCCTSESCEHRWNEVNGEPPPRSRPRQPIDNPLTEDAIRDILTSPGTHVAIGRKYGKNASAIGQIRRGRLYANVLPEIPRRKSQAKPKPSCYKCQYCVDKACKLNWPDLREDGPLIAAKYCNDYEPKSDQQ